jgi:hypothetical protein
MSWADLMSAAHDVLTAALPAHLQIDAAAVPLSQVNAAWAADTRRPRVVCVI